VGFIKCTLASRLAEPKQLVFAILSPADGSVLSFILVGRDFMDKPAGLHGVTLKHDVFQIYLEACGIPNNQWQHAAEHE